jgi:hypothetical protein
LVLQLDLFKRRVGSGQVWTGHKVGSWVVWHSSCLSRAKCLVELARTSLLDVLTCWVGFFGLGLIFQVGSDFSQKSWLVPDLELL